LAAAIEAAAEDDEQRLLAVAWIDASDRIVDSVNTLGHLAGKSGRFKHEDIAVNTGKNAA
jgi:hypothetical protein